MISSMILGCRIAQPKFLEREEGLLVTGEQSLMPKEMENCGLDTVPSLDCSLLLLVVTTTYEVLRNSHGLRGTSRYFVSATALGR